jgi:N-acyl homoserine lactone hydrolase
MWHPITRMGLKSRSAWLALLLACLWTPALRAVEGVSVLPRVAGVFRTNFKYMVAGGASEAVKIPILFYVIRHPKGLVLFDSGLGTEFPDQVNGWWAHRLYQRTLPYEFDPSQAAVVQLKAMGYAPEDVKYIIVSHLHYDHAGGLRDFPMATIVVSRAEWENASVGRLRARFRGVMKEQLVGVEGRLELVDYRTGTAFGPFKASFDLFGDGTLLLLSTPGHTPGHQSLLVTTGSGKRVLLTGDAAWVRENYLWPAPKSLLVRLAEESSEAWASTLAIHDFAERNPDVLIIPGHDPHLWKDLPSEIP